MEPWIYWYSDEEATGILAELIKNAKARAGKVFHIVRIMGLNTDALQASMTFYAILMKGRSPLTRPQREMIATATSRLNECHY